VGAVVLAGTRVVALSANRFTFNRAYWLDTVTGLSVAPGGPGGTGVNGATEPVLHPSGSRVYVANWGLSPDEVLRMDLDAPPEEARFIDTRYHGDYQFCSAVAVSRDGRRLYTGCGVVLASSAVLADDMVYAGRLNLSAGITASLFEYMATMLTVSPGDERVALFEERQYDCNAIFTRNDACHTRLAVYDARTLGRLSLVVLPVHVRGEDRLRQWGRRLMHRSDGSLLLVTEVRTKDEATPTWLLHRVP
jgi:hypothetical protein